MVLNLVESDEKKSVIGIPSEQNIEFSHAAVKTDVSIEIGFRFLGTYVQQKVKAIILLDISYCSVIAK